MQKVETFRIGEREQCVGAIKSAVFMIILLLLLSVFIYFFHIAVAVILFAIAIITICAGIYITITHWNELKLYKEIILMKEIGNKYNIRVKIERHEEDGEGYYLATSKDLPGLVVEGDTSMEVLKLLPGVIDMLLECKKERKAKKE